MSILQTIKDDQFQARKDRDAFRVSLLSSLYSEAATTGLNDGKRESTDKEVVKTINKFIGSIEECLAAGAQPDNLIKEKEILLSYLPAPVDQLTNDQLTGILANIIAEKNVTSPKEMSVVMATLKASYDGQYEGRVASDLVKKLLA